MQTLKDNCMFTPREAHDLKVGDRFSWSPETTTVGEVETIGVISYWGEALFLYKGFDGLHGHLSDHTLVWVIS